VRSFLDKHKALSLQIKMGFLFNVWYKFLRNLWIDLFFFGVQVENLYIRGYIVCEGCFFGVQVGNLYIRGYMVG